MARSRSTRKTRKSIHRQRHVSKRRKNATSKRKLRSKKHAGGSTSQSNPFDEYFQTSPSIYPNEVIEPDTDRWKEVEESRQKERDRRLIEEWKRKYPGVNPMVIEPEDRED